MDKEAIADLIEAKHSELISWLEQQPKESWTQGPEGKWTQGQQALHLLQSVKPLNDALSMPKFLLRFKFGKANRPVRDYDAIVKRYQERLLDAKGKTFKGSQNMKVPTLADKHYILNRLQTESKKLQYKTKKISDTNLDTVILPHPLMGKMPVREIIMWTAHHVEHHTKILKEKY
ncbi:DinB family protein [Winogradskyella echinorum]|uniref:DinB family protein n=1 Tax=Winogradskyella echinorum TaxID=538189 RepID=A0ABR6Y4Y7_9FLAO|nr:DinB family protein [Winogradskyella echinorum]MBC3847781.1 DinB family protein [Winogradskyella echinorum]MBC5752129.1 DinB family protein [Winogradskyella echinorum]